MATPSLSPTVAPTLAPTCAVNASEIGCYLASVDYGPWWLPFIIVIVVAIALVLGVRQILANAEAKRLRVQKNLKRLRKRIMNNDEFMKQHKYSWDWVFVFKVAEADEKPTAFQRKNGLRTVVSKLSEAGLQTSMFYSVQQDEVYCKVRAHPDRLKAEADRINLNVLLDAGCLKAICDRGRLETEAWGPIVYANADGRFKSDLEPFEGHFAPYNKERSSADDVPYATYEEGAFRNVDRIKLIASIIEASPSEQGCGLKMKDLTLNKACLAIFPLHDHLALTLLQQKWLRLFALPHRQPEAQIKDYFGEKIGLYFVWLGHYTLWLISAAFVGWICWVTVAADGNDPDAPSIPYFTCFMCLWATLYLEAWKRTEKFTACRWGMVDFEQEQMSRPEFEALAFERESAVTGKPEKYYPDKLRNPVLCYSAMISSTFIVTVAVAIISIYIFKAFLSDPAPYGKVYFGDGDEDSDSSFALGSIIGSSMNAIQIQVMNAVYEKVAFILTMRENHRTETAHEDALISKTFSFKFVNSFMALIYLAFIKQPLAVAGAFGEIKCYPNCFAELNTSLGIIFIANIVVGNVGEIAPAIIKAKLKTAAESKGSTLADAGVKLTDVEKQFIAEEYDVLLGTFKDYGEMVIQFGYCTLFVAAFPLAPLLAFINNAIEIRVDAWKLCQIHRRPYAVGAEDIGTWFTFLDIMSTLAVVSNMALFCFTGNQLSEAGWSWQSRIVFFSVMEHVLLSIKYLIAVIIPDVPAEVEEQMKREEFLVDKVVNNLADDVEDEEYETVEMIDLSVKLTDLVPSMDRETIKEANESHKFPKSPKL